MIIPKLTWSEIVSKYPDKWVGLTDIEREENSADIKRAVVVCTSDTVSEDKMLEMVFDNEIETSIFTTPDNYFQLGIIH